MPIVFARRTAVVCLALVLNLAAAHAAAAGRGEPIAQGFSPSEAAVAEAQDFGSAAPPAAPVQRPPALVPLYVSLASLQALDVASTLHALDHGGVELNPVIRGSIDSPAGLIALKTGFVGLSVYSSEKLWKKHRTAAVLMMVALNGAYGAIVAHNYSIAR